MTHIINSTTTKHRRFGDIHSIFVLRIHDLKFEVSAEEREKWGSELSRPRIKLAKRLILNYISGIERNALKSVSDLKLPFHCS